MVSGFWRGLRCPIIYDVGDLGSERVWSCAGEEVVGKGSWAVGESVSSQGRRFQPVGNV